MKTTTKRSMLVGSERTRERQLARRTAAPTIIVSGVEPGRLETLSLTAMGKLNVDERYQRVRIENHVNTLIHVIKGGGVIPDPISVAERPDGSRWIVDGQQRWWAHTECAQPIRAMIYKVRDFESERSLFLAMNRTVDVRSNTLVKAWPGKGASMLRESAESGALAGRIAFGIGGGKSKQIDAGVMLKGMLTAAEGTTAHKGIERVLTKLDSTIATTQAAEDRARAFMALSAGAFDLDDGRPPLLAVMALARVAHERWKGKHPTMPNERVLRGLRAVNWSTVAPGFAVKFSPMFETIVQKKWPE